MRVYTYSEARQKLASLLDIAQTEGAVAIRRRNGQTFINWLVSRDGQRAIAAFRIGGEQVFIPNARREGS